MLEHKEKLFSEDEADGAGEDTATSQSPFKFNQGKDQVEDVVMAEPASPARSGQLS